MVPVTTYEESEENAQSQTHRWCPVNVRVNEKSFAFQILAVVSADVVASNLKIPSEMETEEIIILRIGTEGTFENVSLMCIYLLKGIKLGGVRFTQFPNETFASIVGGNNLKTLSLASRISHLLIHQGRWRCFERQYRHQELTLCCKPMQWDPRLECCRFDLPRWALLGWDVKLKYSQDHCIHNSVDILEPSSCQQDSSVCSYRTSQIFTVWSSEAVYIHLPSLWNPTTVTLFLCPSKLDTWILNEETERFTGLGLFVVISKYLVVGFPAVAKNMRSGEISSWFTCFRMINP